LDPWRQRRQFFERFYAASGGIPNPWECNERADIPACLWHLTGELWGIKVIKEKTLGEKW